MNETTPTESHKVPVPKTRRFTAVRLGLVFKKFAQRDPEDMYPSLSAEPGQLAMKANKVYLEKVEYLSNAGLYISPAHPDAELLSRRAKEDPVSVIADNSYWYLSYAIPDEETGLAFLEHYREQTQTGTRLLADIELESRTIFRLRQELVQFRIEGDFPNDKLIRYIGGKPTPVA